VSLAFPAISTGIYGYPAEYAAPVALTSAAESLRQSASVREVRFVLFDAVTLEQFRQTAAKYLPDAHYS